jgi:D-alanyl-D-alanine dipeptidase
MGTEFDETSEQSHTRYYEEKNERGEKLNPREEKALVNRRLLYHLMAEVDFTNFRNEWWHFDYGNKVWACMKGYDQKAFYGRATVKFRWK